MKYQVGVVTLFLLGASGCLKIKALPQAGELLEDKRSPGQNLADDLAGPQELVDGASLRIERFNLANVQKGRALLKKASYGIDGRADYVEFEACLRQSGQCEKGSELTNEIFIPVFKAGTVIVRLRACMQPEHAKNKDVPCGQWQERQYEQHDSFDPKTIQLLSDRIRAVSLISSYGSRVQQSLETFRKRKAECVADRTWLEEVDAYVQNYLVLGSELIRFSVGATRPELHKGAIAGEEGSAYQGGEASAQLKLQGEQPSVPLDEHWQFASQKLKNILYTGALVGVGLTGLGVGGTLLYKHNKRVQTVIDRFNRSRFGKAGKYGAATGLVMAGGVMGLYALNFLVLRPFTESPGAPSCLAWQSARQEITEVEKQLDQMRLRVLSLDEQLTAATPPK